MNLLTSVTLSRQIRSKDAVTSVYSCYSVIMVLEQTKDGTRHIAALNVGVCVCVCGSSAHTVVYVSGRRFIESTMACGRIWCS